MYSKLPPEDEKLINLKHAEDIYWNTFKKKVHLVGSYYANISRCTVRTSIFFLKSCRLWDNVDKFCRAGQATDNNTAHAHCMLDNYGCRHTHTQYIWILFIAFHGNNGYTTMIFGATHHLPSSIVKETTVVAMHNIVLNFIKDSDKTRIKITRSK